MAEKTTRKNRTAAERAEDLRKRAEAIEAREAEKARRGLARVADARVDAVGELYDVLGIEPMARDRSEKRRAAELVRAVAELHKQYIVGDEVAPAELHSAE